MHRGQGLRGDDGRQPNVAGACYLPKHIVPLNNIGLRLRGVSIQRGSPVLLYGLVKFTDTGSILSHLYIHLM